MKQKLDISASDPAPDVLLKTCPNCPSVSVVIPCYNSENSIGRAIQSVLDQNHPNIEIIVIDDGSADHSLDVIKSFGERIAWRTGRNRGACTARNCGLDLASAEFIIFLDSDDYIESDSVGEWAAHGSDVDLVFGPFAYETRGSRTFGKPAGPVVSTDSILSQWLDGWFTPPCSVLWRRSFLLTIGGWNPSALRNQDGEVTIRALLYGARVTVADRGLGVYVQHEHPYRISKRAGREILASELSCFQDLWTLAQAQGQGRIRKNFAQVFYQIAYEAFANRIDDIGHVALFRARQLGLKGHTGTLAHRTLAGILGLRNKLRFTQMLKRRRILPSTSGI